MFKALLCIAVGAPVTLVLQGCGGDTPSPAPSPAPGPAPGRGQPTHVGNISLGCEARTQDQREHWPSNFSLAEQLGRHGTLQVVACIVQGWDQVIDLVRAADTGAAAETAGDFEAASPSTAIGYDSKWNTAPFVEKCIAIGSSCGTPCGNTAVHSDTCDNTTMTIKPEYLYNVQDHPAGQGFSTRHVVSINYPMDTCEACEMACADSHWEEHCSLNGKNDAGTNCDAWKCMDPPDADDSPEVHCDERYKCQNVVPSGLQIEDLSVHAEFDENEIPLADKGLLYSVIFAGTNLQRSSGTAQPAGSWQLIYTPRETEALRRDLPSMAV